jgi:hypothetical protein
MNEYDKRIEKEVHAQASLIHAFYTAMHSSGEYEEMFEEAQRFKAFLHWSHSFDEKEQREECVEAIFNWMKENVGPKGEWTKYIIGNVPYPQEIAKLALTELVKDGIVIELGEGGGRFKYYLNPKYKDTTPIPKTN